MGKRICLYGGPGVGKSTLATRVFSELKSKKYDVEYVGEYVKQMAYEGRVPQSYDQLDIFSTQIHWEDLRLRHVPLVVCECPPMMCVMYSKTLGFPCWEELLDIAIKWEHKHDAINYFINRSFEYNPIGRFQTIEEAKKIDYDMSAFLMEHIQFNGVIDFDKLPVPGIGGICSVEDLISNIEKEIA